MDVLVERADGGGGCDLLARGAPHEVHGDAAARARAGGLELQFHLARRQGVEGAEALRGEGEGAVGGGDGLVVAQLVPRHEGGGVGGALADPDHGCRALRIADGGAVPGAGLGGFRNGLPVKLWRRVAGGEFCEVVGGIPGADDRDRLAGVGGHEGGVSPAAEPVALHQRGGPGRDVLEGVHGRGAFRGVGRRRHLAEAAGHQDPVGGDPGTGAPHVDRQALARAGLEALGLDAQPAVRPAGQRGQFRQIGQVVRHEEIGRVLDGVRLQQVPGGQGQAREAVGGCRSPLGAVDPGEASEGPEGLPRTGLLLDQGHLQPRVGLAEVEGGHRADRPGSQDGDVVVEGAAGHRKVTGAFPERRVDGFHEDGAQPGPDQRPQDLPGPGRCVRGAAGRGPDARGMETGRLHRFPHRGVVQGGVPRQGLVQGGDPRVGRGGGGGHLLGWRVGIAGEEEAKPDGRGEGDGRSHENPSINCL